MSAADADDLNDPAARESTPWRVLDRKGDKILVQWRGYSRENASLEEVADFPQFVNGGS